MKYFIPKKQDKEVISIRIDSETLQQIDMEAANIGISRNEFINQCIEFAMKHMEHRIN